MSEDELPVPDESAVPEESLAPGEAGPPVVSGRRAPVAAQPLVRRRFARRDDPLEFERVWFFTDAVFAIALTLLSVSIVVPALDDTASSSDLWEALGDLAPNLLVFFIAFWIIGNYWIANHRFVGSLAEVDDSLTHALLLYLAFVAILPFPTTLLSRYTDNPLAVSIFALAMATVSGLEVVMFRSGHRHDLMVVPLSDEAYRWWCRAALVPVVSFLTSIPLAYLHPGLGIAWWASAIPMQMVHERSRPAELAQAPIRRRAG